MVNLMESQTKYCVFDHITLILVQSYSQNNKYLSILIPFYQKLCNFCRVRRYNNFLMYFVKTKLNE